METRFSSSSHLKMNVTDNIHNDKSSRRPGVEPLNGNLAKGSGTHGTNDKSPLPFRRSKDFDMRSSLASENHQRFSYGEKEIRTKNVVMPPAPKNNAVKSIFPSEVQGTVPEPTEQQLSSKQGTMEEIHPYVQSRQFIQNPHTKSQCITPLEVNTHIESAASNHQFLDEIVITQEEIYEILSSREVCDPTNEPHNRPVYLEDIPMTALRSLVQKKEIVHEATLYILAGIFSLGAELKSIDLEFTSKGGEGMHPVISMDEARLNQVLIELSKVTENISNGKITIRNMKLIAMCLRNYQKLADQVAHPSDDQGEMAQTRELSKYLRCVMDYFFNRDAQTKYLLLEAKKHQIESTAKKHVRPSLITNSQKKPPSGLSKTPKKEMPSSSKCTTSRVSVPTSKISSRQLNNVARDAKKEIRVSDFNCTLGKPRSSDNLKGHQRRKSASLSLKLSNPKTDRVTAGRSLSKRTSDVNITCIKQKNPPRHERSKSSVITPAKTPGHVVKFSTLDRSVTPNLKMALEKALRQSSKPRQPSTGRGEFSSGFGNQAKRMKSGLKNTPSTSTTHRDKQSFGMKSLTPVTKTPDNKWKKLARGEWKTSEVKDVSKGCPKGRISLGGATGRPELAVDQAEDEFQQYFLQKLDHLNDMIRKGKVELSSSRKKFRYDED